MEATITRLVETKNLKTNIWKEAAKEKRAPYFHYDALVDAVTLLLVDKKTYKVVHYIDEHVALLYRPDDKEIVGLRIEAFEKSFLPAYAELQKAWRLSENCKELKDFGELIISVRKQEALVTRQISNIARPVAAKVGMELPALV